MPQTRDENTLRGRPLDSEGGGGGWYFWSGKIIYFHHVLGRKIYFRVNRGQNIYFQPQQIFEKSKKKKNKQKKKTKKKTKTKKGGGGGGLCEGLVEGQDMVFYVLHNVLQTTST